GYMAPEQVTGLPVDHRCDVFAFGAIFFEMLLGRRAFKGESQAETLFAILKQDPLESAASRALPPEVDRILRHCLEKSPDERFQSARDLAFHLEAVSGPSEVAAVAPRERGGRRRTAAAALLALVLVA